MKQLELRTNDGQVLATSRCRVKTALVILREVAREEFNMDSGDGYITEIEDGVCINKFNV